MGSLVEINDTLRIITEQGFPTELDINKHLQAPYKLEDFKDKIFDFYEKQQTSGKYKIIRLNTPEEMKKAFELIHTDPTENYFD